MSKNKSKANAESAANTVIEEVNSSTPTSTATLENTNAETKRPGRPVDTESARQKRLVEQEMKKLLSGRSIHRGRPTNPESERQKKLANKTPGLKPGRPKMSEEQKAENERLRKERQAEDAKRVAALAKSKLITAGLWDEEKDMVKEGVTAEQVKTVLTAEPVEA